MIAIFRNSDYKNDVRRIIEFDIKDQELKQTLLKLKVDTGRPSYYTTLEFFDGTVEQYNDN